MSDLSKVPRGIRNNNPGNIRFDGTLWKGLVGNDGTFCIYDRPENGIRAIERILKQYQKKPGSPGVGGPGLDTVREVIDRWAPHLGNDGKVENNTEAYIKAVCKLMKMGENECIQPQHHPALIAAIIQHENGEQPYTEQQILEGIAGAA